MKRFLMAVIAALTAGLIATPIYAADTHESHHAGTEAQRSYAVKGEIISVDQDAGKAKIRHEAIPELGWSGMTMVFLAADKNLLKNVKSGDQVDFTIAKNPSSGQYTIQTLQPVQ
ncbi:MAG: copper-binding protein [Methylophilaceae bacterium]